MKKLWIFAIAFAMAFTGCINDASDDETHYTTPQPQVNSSTSVYTQPTYTQPVTTTYVYDVIVAGICKALTVQSTGQMTGSCQYDATASLNN